MRSSVCPVVQARAGCTKSPHRDAVRSEELHHHGPADYRLGVAMIQPKGPHGPSTKPSFKATRRFRCYTRGSCSGCREGIARGLGQGCVAQRQAMAERSRRLARHAVAHLQGARATSRENKPCQDPRGVRRHSKGRRTIHSSPFATTPRSRFLHYHASV